MSEPTTAASGGIGFTGLLTLLFIALKLTGYIDWRWLWVLSPIWISAALIFVVVGFVIVVTLLPTFVALVVSRKVVRK